MLITGESGTGKELVARAIHNAGAARRAARSSPSTARAIPRDAARERAVRPRGAARSPARAAAASRASSSSPTAAPCSSTRSATCRSRCRPSCCASCRSDEFARVGGTREMPRRRAASSPPPTATSREAVARGRFRAGPLLPPAASSTSSCRRCASARERHPAAGRALPARSSPRALGKRGRALAPDVAGRAARATPGRATSASSRTCSRARSTCAPDDPTELDQIPESLRPRHRVPLRPSGCRP